jgi:hypothetical protein
MPIFSPMLLAFIDIAVAASFSFAESILEILVRVAISHETIAPLRALIWIRRSAFLVPPFSPMLFAFIDVAVAASFSFAESILEVLVRVAIGHKAIAFVIDVCERHTCADRKVNTRGGSLLREPGHVLRALDGDQAIGAREGLAGGLEGRDAFGAGGVDVGNRREELRRFCWAGRGRFLANRGAGGGASCS